MKKANRKRKGISLSEARLLKVDEIERSMNTYFAKIKRDKAIHRG